MVDFEIKFLFEACFDKIFVLTVFDIFGEASNCLERRGRAAHEDADGDGRFDKLADFQTEINEGNEGLISGFFGIRDGPGGKDICGILVELKREAFEKILRELSVGIDEEKELALRGLGTKISLMANISNG